MARLDELFFLKLALTADPGNKSAIRVDTVSPSGLTGADFGKYPLVILANVESLPLPAVEALEGYVDRGGSLLVFLGDQVNPDFYNPNLAAPDAAPRRPDARPPARPRGRPEGRRGRRHRRRGRRRARRALRVPGPAVRRLLERRVQGPLGDRPGADVGRPDAGLDGLAAACC